MQGNSSELFRHVCRRCGQTKPLEEFKTYDNGYGVRRRRQCSGCYKPRVKTERPPKVVPTVKRCNRCGETKPVGDFYLTSPHQKNGKRYSYPWCKRCNAAKVGKWWRTPAGRRKLRKDNLRRVYGITEERYKEMLDAQNGLCAICLCAETTRHRRTKGPRELCVDHDHKSGKIRGLLCSACNRGIACFRENPSFLHAAIAYLLRHGQST